MRNQIKFALVYASLLVLIVVLASNLAQAAESAALQETELTGSLPAEDEQQYFELDQAELDQILAPIALYPDSVLAQVLVASTYPLEVIQAARWRAEHQHLSESEALELVADQDWDPSVKALIPFHDLLQQLSEDLDWLQDVGDAFLINQQQVLASIQTLRQRAHQQGNLANNQYIEVVEEDSNIIIEPVNQQVIYIPYYDTRVVYGDWWWQHHPPRYWHRPAHYYWHAGLFWSPRIYLRHTLFFGGFHWQRQRTVVYRTGHRGQRYDDGVRRVRSRDYQAWKHNPHHRRGVRYNRHTAKTVYRKSQPGAVNVVRNTQSARTLSSQRPVQVRQSDNAQRGQQLQRTQQRLQQSSQQARQPRVAHPNGRNQTQRRANLKTERQRDMRAERQRDMRAERTPSAAAEVKLAQPKHRQSTNPGSAVPSRNQAQRPRQAHSSPRVRAPRPSRQQVAAPSQRHAGATRRAAGSGRHSPKQRQR